MGVIERAFCIAPECRTLKEIQSRLHQEGFPLVHSHMKSPSLRKTLRKHLKGD